MAYLWPICGLSMAYLWPTCGLPVAYLWLTYGLLMANDIAQWPAEPTPKL